MFNLPFGDPGVAIVNEILQYVRKGDIVVDASNENYKTCHARQQLFSPFDVAYIATSHNKGASVVSLCPSSFGTTQIALIPKIKGMRAVAPNPVANSVIKARTSGSRQPIWDMFPSAATSFHELFNLIPGNENTFISAPQQEEYQVSRMLKLNYANSVKNPEMYTVVATAYDYTSNSVADSTGNRIEFSSGYITQG
ncbi:hypothetical protein CPAR01_09841 [Colletotrichum paranaense]|uniref:Uncharacterized protein n=1 Tax=Colletotrichum paranaense TaxID=1914294 RepID=A0ABQ9SDK3_9PEZI|nr:uncharacterized protein CPAR01_09841 [Colletotrichum paranaense]KAK1533133.1 hypothetical protein CPAR01_09841 [Colletotrichum paranaense]